MSERAAIVLLGQRRFLPYFLVQFLGAFNDNVYKNALIIMIAFQQAASAAEGNLLTNIAAAVFILPFFLFGAVSGQIAEKYEKSGLIRKIKLFELVLMCLAAYAFWQRNTAMLIALLFFMGLQSTLFSPIKYSLLPQQLKRDEIVGGNSLVSAGTFLAILLGTMLGGWLIADHEAGRAWVSIAVITIAALGWLASRFVPTIAASSPNLRVDRNPLWALLNTIRVVRRERSVFLSILGISWFWLIGVVYLTQLPNYTQYFLGGDETVVTLLLAGFSIGVGLGSFVCAWLSRHRVEPGLVPLGALGVTGFGLDLFFATPAGTGNNLLGIGAYLAQPGSVRVLVDIIGLGAMAGLYIVPLFAMVQTRSDPAELARTIAGNSIINALFMVVGSVMAAGLLAAGLSIPQLFAVLAVMNIVVAAYIFVLVPEFTLRFVCWLLMHSIYRLKTRHLSRIPQHGPAVLAVNHVSFVDALIVMASVQRPVRFVMYYKIFRIPILSYLFRAAGAIPIAGQKEDAALFYRANQRIAELLDAGEVVGIFPEGRISDDGELHEFRRGIEHIVARSPCPVVPMALRGLWGSLFSRSSGGALKGGPRKLWAKIELVAAPAIAAENVRADDLKTCIAALLQDRY